jgi:hypothetical protein
MTCELIIVLDRGCLKAFKVFHNSWETNPRIDLLQEIQTAAHGKLSDWLTDKPGRFPGSGPIGDKARAHGENHHLESEFHRRMIQQLAKHAENILRQHPECDCWHLATPREISRELMDRLSPQAIDGLRICLPENLVKASEAEILDHFLQRKE